MIIPFLLMAMIVLAILSMGVTLYALFLGFDTVSWALVWKRVDWTEAVTFFVLVVVAAFGWLSTALVGHTLWMQLL